jgi:hypothetical protein
MTDTHMHRREALQKLAILLGGTLSLPVQAALLGEKLNLVPIDIPDDQQALIDELAETIMPATDTPGAKDAGVGKFIVHVIQDSTSKTGQDAFLQGLKNTNALSQATFGKPFIHLPPAQQQAIVSQLARQEAEFFRNLRELTLVGFFTSEVGATRVLEYLPVPGRFQGDIPLKPGQRVWAT